MTKTNLMNTIRLSYRSEGTLFSLEDFIQTLISFSEVCTGQDKIVIDIIIEEMRGNQQEHKAKGIEDSFVDIDNMKNIFNRVSLIARKQGESMVCFDYIDGILNNIELSKINLN